jgi:hypothetical protein
MATDPKGIADMAHVPRGHGVVLLLALALSLSPAIAVVAQNQSQLHIHETAEPQQVSTTGGAVGLSFQTSFSLLDPENQVLTAFEIVDATIEIEDNSYTAVVQELETPWTLVVLVDASKTMGSFTASSAFREVRTSLASAVNGAPDNSNIAVMTFDDTVRTVFEFDQAKDQAAQAIDRVRAKTSGNSCLNNGLYEAVNRLAGAPGRRAVILSTASLDDCGNRTQQDVLSLAEANRVQILAVGLQGYSATQDGLELFTAPTGGLAEIRNEGNLVFGFSNIFAILQNQWSARATVYPSAGNQTATLVVNLSDESSLSSDPIPFVSSQDYLPPAEIDLVGTVQSLADGIIFNLGITQRDEIRQLNVSIVSKDTGQSVMAQSLQSFSDVNRLPTVSLIPGLEYTLQVTAVDFDGQVLSEDQLEFKYEPPQATIVVTEVEPPAIGENEFEITYSAQNLAEAVKFRGWLVAGQTETRLESTMATVPLGEPLLLPASGVRAGEYGVIVQGLDAGDTVLAESKPFQLIYQPPGLFQRLGNWASNSPLALAGITALCCLTSIGLVAIFWVILPRRAAGADASIDLVMPERAKPAKETPGRPEPRRPERLEIKRPARPPQPPKRVEQKPPPEKPRAEKPSPPELQPDDIPSEPLPEGAPTATLTVVEPKSVTFAVEMTKMPFSVGRHKTNDASLPLGSSSGVSSHHLTVQYMQGVYFVKDEKSTYGTSVNGEAIPKGKGKQLHNGDIIGLGPMVKIKFNKRKADQPPS